MIPARVLITVKTYPLPSNKYEELVCTAGITADGKWIRIYPIPFRSKPYQEQYKKYSWVELNLIRNHSDFRPESYRPQRGFEEPINTVSTVDTSNTWQERKRLVLQEVFTSMNELIQRAKGKENKSLATLKPLKIIDFIVEEDEREWKKEWQDQLNQYRLFDANPRGEGKRREVVRKLPYKYYYTILTEGDHRPRRMMIEDWEIGALYWNCLARTEGDETAANNLVRQKYFDEFVKQRDIYLFVGTTKQFHNKSLNPFVIIGLFYPPKREAEQLSLF
ncbi:MAG: hypothetical protein DWB42_15745 [Chloroflexi bacterium]|nr:hypothetical protein [Chloroflexota bacterium]MDL1885832.1 hypothetical protein [Anaerolineae bacterium CFX8]